MQQGRLPTAIRPRDPGGRVLQMQQGLAPYGYPAEGSGWAGAPDAAGPAPYGYPAEGSGYGPGQPGHDYRRSRRRRRWPVVALAVLIVAAAFWVWPRLTGPGGSQARPAASTGTAPSAPRTGTRSPAAARPAPQGVTFAAARHVLAAYLAANNEANRLRSARELASVEGGSSYRLDAGSYRWTRVTDPQNLHYKPITFADPSFYIPRESGYPLWFAVRGQWTGLDGSQAGLDAAYLVFARASAAAPWLEVLEPDLLAGSPQIRIAITRAGYAEQVTAATADGMSVAPSAVQSLTARYLDGGGTGLTGFSKPGNLQDLSDKAFWRPRLPQGSGLAVRHMATGNRVFGLRTADGGALLFYDLSAIMTLAAPPGDVLRLQIPGYYSESQPVTSAAVRYVDQFAVFDPPRGQAGSPSAIASVGGIVSRR